MLLHLYTTRFGLLSYTAREHLRGLESAKQYETIEEFNVDSKAEYTA